MKLNTMILVAMMAAGSSLLAISSDSEVKILERALSEAAVTGEQKAVVGKYFNAIAAEKRKEADKMRAMAKVSGGGKFVTQDVRSADLMKKADILEDEAKSFEDLSRGSTGGYVNK